MDNKQLKRGALSVAITAGILAAIILFNILFSFLAGRFLWVIDTSPNDLVKISDYSRELLDQVDPDSNDITIYFLADPDELNNYELEGHQMGESNSTWGMSYIYNLAKLYEKEYSFISVDLLDSSDDADYIRKHFALTIGTTLTPLSIVMENKVDGRSSYRTMTRDEFYAISGSTMYFRGDDKMTSTVLSLSGDSPLVYFLEGHGEKVGAAGNAEDLGEASALAALFREAGYLVKKIDLSKEDFPTATDDIIAGGPATVVVYGPERDFLVDADGANEITRLRKFLHLKNHNLMVFMDPGVEDMPHFDEYLEDYWGVNFEDNIVVTDTSDPTNTPAITEDGKSFYGAYELDSTSPGSALTSSLTSLSSLPGAFFGPSRTIAMKTAWSNNQESSAVMEGTTVYKLGATFRAPALSAAIFENDGGFKCFDENVYEKYVAVYYDAKYEEMYAQYHDEFYQTTYDKYRQESLDDFEKEGLSTAEIDQKCKTYAESYVKEKTDYFMEQYLSLSLADASAIMTLTHGAWMYTTSETVDTYLLACGSTAFASEDAINNAAYSNRDTLYTAIYLFGKNVLPYDIEIIEIEASSSLNISNGMSVAWTVILAVVLPLCAVVAGVIVMVKRRKHN